MIVGYRNILGPKSWTQKLTKILNYIKSSCIMLEYSHYIYCLQEKSTHFVWSKAIDKFRSGSIETFWAQKIIKEKLAKFTQRFWTISSLLISQNILIPPDHILPTCTKSIFTTSAYFSHQLSPNFVNSLAPPKLCTNFYQ